MPAVMKADIKVHALRSIDGSKCRDCDTTRKHSGFPVLAGDGGMA